MFVASASRWREPASAEAPAAPRPAAARGCILPITCRAARRTTGLTALALRGGRLAAPLKSRRVVRHAWLTFQVYSCAPAVPGWDQSYDSRRARSLTGRPAVSALFRRREHYIAKQADAYTTNNATVGSDAAAADSSSCSGLRPPGCRQAALPAPALITSASARPCTAAAPSAAWAPAPPPAAPAPPPLGTPPGPGASPPQTRPSPPAKQRKQAAGMNDATSDKGVISGGQEPSTRDPSPRKT